MTASASATSIAPSANEPPRVPDALPARTLGLILSLVSAVSALGGGAELAWFREGNAYLPPLELLKHTPFDNFLIPGLILALWVGGTSLGAAVLLWRRAAAAVDALLLAGGTLSVWIVAELGMLRTWHALHLLYGGLGLSLLSLGVWGALQSNRPRTRWTVWVTATESVGFAVPVVVALLLNAYQASETWLFFALTAAGAVEGALLGLGQAIALPLPVRQAPYMWLTAAGAALAWSLILAANMLLTQATEPTPLSIVMCALACGCGLLVLGGAQWLELRRRSPKATRWILWTALAWLLALPASLLPGLFVDHSTPLLPALLLWGSGGILMAYMMALITWQGAKRLRAPTNT